MISHPQPKARRSAVAIERNDGRIVRIGHIHEDAVKVAYRRWAPVYDHTFGKIATDARRHTSLAINKNRSGKVLEVGVGTGLSLPDYKRDLEIVGIDLSREMLEKARQRVEELNLTNVTGLHEMDAGELEFPDNSFDTVVVMFVMTVVPDPEKVMRELSRVVRPGGEVVLVNHFSQEEGVRGWVERRMAPFAELIGWRPVFDHSRVMVCDNLKLIERRSLRPFGIFTLMRFEKVAESQRVAAE
jgi:phosphatidylethanolamine/phosphatidyl-N-methylethanolamine N-methyltransferase